MKIGYEKKTEVTSIVISIKLEDAKEIEAFKYILDASYAHIAQYDIRRFGREASIKLINNLIECLT